MREVKRNRGVEKKREREGKIGGKDGGILREEEGREI